MSLNNLKKQWLKCLMMIILKMIPRFLLQIIKVQVNKNTLKVIGNNLINLL